MDTLPLSAAIAVFLYYLLTWLWIGRHGVSEAVVVRYEPPAGVSPAAMRYLWKRGFDDRTFWAAALSLVSKGLARLSAEDPPTLRATPAGKCNPPLPDDERALLRGLLINGKKGLVLSGDDSAKGFVTFSMARALRANVVGRWFNRNRQYVVAGAICSAIPVVLAAHAYLPVQFVAVTCYLGILGSGIYFGAFAAMREWELLRTFSRHPSVSAFRRALLLSSILVPCVAATIGGFLLLFLSFGLELLLLVIAMAALDLIFLFLLSAPTEEGRRLLLHIEGFRQFLCSVEKLPLDSLDAPAKQSTYERYLPYAIALEVEQSWADRFVALASSSHFIDTLGGHTFQLGYWDDEPVEVVFWDDPKTHNRFQP